MPRVRPRQGRSPVEPESQLLQARPLRDRRAGRRHRGDPRHRLGPVVRAQVDDRVLFQRVGAGPRHRVEAQVPGRRDRRGDEDQLHLRRLPAGPADVAALPLRAGRVADQPAAGRRARGHRRPHDPRRGEGRGRARAAHPADAAGHHRHELPRARLRRPAAPDAADRVDAEQRLHPEHAVDGLAVRERGVRHHRPAAPARHRGHAREPQQADDDDQRPARGDRRARACRTARPGRSTGSTRRSPGSTRRS